MISKSNILFIVILSICFFFQKGFSQSNQNRALTLFEEGIIAKNEEKTLEALRFFLRSKSYLIESDTLLKVHIYNEIGKIFMYEKLFDKAIDNFQIVLETKSINIKVNNKQKKTQILIGKCYQEKGEFIKAISIYESVLSKGISEIDSSRSLLIIQELVLCYKKVKEYEKALEYELENLAQVKYDGNTFQKITILNNIGYLYKYLNKNDKALNYFDSAQILVEKIEGINTQDVTPAINKAILLQNLGKNEEALTQLQYIYRQIKNSPEYEEVEAELEFLQARIYFDIDDLYNAELYCSQLIKHDITKNELVKWVRDGQELHSAILQKMEKFEDALEAYKSYLSLRDSLLFEERLGQERLLQQQSLLENSESEIRLLIANQDKQRLEAEKQIQVLNNLQQSQKLQKIQLQQEILLREQDKANFLLERERLESVKREKEIELLQKNEELQNIALSQKEMKEKQREQELRILNDKNQLLEKEGELNVLKVKEAQQRTYYISTIISIVTLLIVVYLFTIRKKNRQLKLQSLELKNKNEELELNQEEISSQRDQLEERNLELSKTYKKIKDSVQYAKRIQSSILVPIEEVSRHYMESFIFFKPREQVSGDFYWFAAIDNKKIIAAIDCTGHGVPGAFMSLIANDLLNEIVYKNRCIEPGDILNELNLAIKKTLNQKRGGNKDGMDMALFVFDNTNRVATFAGAKNPIVIIEDGELKVIKGDKAPIGGGNIYGQQSFTTHTKQLSKNTFIYMYSDGFVDQFGGSENRKFLSKNFKKLLYDTHKLPLVEQCNYLENTFNSWTKGYRQMDDVLVIGLKV